MSEQLASRLDPWRRRLGQTRVRLGSVRARVGPVRTRARAALPFALGVVAALLALLIYRALVPPPRPLTTNDVNAAIVQAFASATVPPAYSARVYQAIRPSFVLVQTQGAGGDGASRRGLGSGVVVTDRGDILTSLHVVADASEIQVTFADGTKSPARVTARQPENDIAVLRALQPPAQLVPATLGNPSAMRVGDEVYAVGNPLGLYSSLSAGVISGFDRTFPTPDGGPELEGLIQFDAAVNPGNSGGPLLNRDGQVIGIVTGLVNPTEQNFFIGIGFAVTITVAGGAAGLPPH